MSATMNPHLEYLLRLGDNVLILGQRLAQWCGHGPVLEQDIAITNIALDLMGQANSLLIHAAAIENAGRSADDLAFLRDAGDFRNVLLVEQPNEDWAYTIVRQFLFDSHHYFLLEALQTSSDEQLAAIAAKSLKEVTYHLRYSSEWMIRLGDGTELSHEKMQTALNDLWMYQGELLSMDEVDAQMMALGIGVDQTLLQPLVQERIQTVLAQATLIAPSDSWMQSGGKQGRHSEHLGYLLAEMQFLPRAYPGQKW